MSENIFSLKVWLYFLCRVFAGVISRLPTWVLISGLVLEQIKLLIISIFFHHQVFVAFYQDFITLYQDFVARIIKTVLSLLQTEGMDIYSVNSSK